jgi:adenylate cyclase
MLFVGTRQAVPWFVTFAGLVLVSAGVDAARAREREQAKSERLLLNVLPEPVAARLKQEDGIIADAYAAVTVLFADIVGFTRLTERLSASNVAALLDRVFARWDALAAEHGVEKIRTIGDAYIVAGGIPARRPAHTEAICEIALAMGPEVAHLAAETGHALEVRIGLDTGPVVAGVIGRAKFSYDLWGDTVNTASRMQSHAPGGAIQVTARTFDRLRHRYELRAHGTIEVKGQGADAPLSPPRAPLRPRAPGRARPSRARASRIPPPPVDKPSRPATPEPDGRAPGIR